MLYPPVKSVILYQLQQLSTFEILCCICRQLQTCLFLSLQLKQSSVTFLMSGALTIGRISGKGHGKNPFVQVVSSFLPPHNFPICQNPEKNRVLNWPPPKMVESRTWHPQKMAFQNLPPPHTNVLDSVFFLGGKFWTLLFLYAGPVLDSVIFAGFWHKGNLGGGKKDEAPCTYQKKDLKQFGIQGKWSELCTNDKGAEEGEAHCINSNTNDTYYIYFFNFLRPIFFYHDANCRICYKILGFPTFIQTQK